MATRLVLVDCKLIADVCDTRNILFIMENG
jgi:hypothetical protein